MNPFMAMAQGFMQKTMDDTAEQDKRDAKKAAEFEKAIFAARMKGQEERLKEYEEKKNAWNGIKKSMYVNPDGALEDWFKMNGISGYRDYLESYNKDSKNKGHYLVPDWSAEDVKEFLNQAHQEWEKAPAPRPAGVESYDEIQYTRGVESNGVYRSLRNMIGTSDPKDPIITPYSGAKALQDKYFQEDLKRGKELDTKAFEKFAGRFKFKKEPVSDEAYSSGKDHNMKIVPIAEEVDSNGNKKVIYGWTDPKDPTMVYKLGTKIPIDPEKIMKESKPVGPEMTPPQRVEAAEDMVMAQAANFENVKSERQRNVWGYINQLSEDAKWLGKGKNRRPDPKSKEARDFVGFIGLVGGYYRNAKGPTENAKWEEALSRAALHVKDVEEVGGIVDGNFTSWEGISEGVKKAAKGKWAGHFKGRIDFTDAPEGFLSVGGKTPPTPKTQYPEAVNSKGEVLIFKDGQWQKKPQ